MTRVGYGLIETMRVRDGRLPLLERHLARLRRSLAALGLPAPGEDPGAVALDAAGAGNAVARLEVWDGRAVVATRELPPAGPPAVVVAAEPHAPYPHKTTERGPFARACAEARRAGADDALLVTADGHVAEGTVWSVFWWDGERLCTPAIDLGVLPGVARARVMELVGVEEVRVPVEALAGRSLFLTNAVRGILPIATLGGAAVSADPRTAELSLRFWPD